MKIIDYQIIRRDDWANAFVMTSLEGKVRKAIKDGWQPLGGPFVFDGECQAMVKYQEEEDSNYGGAM